MAAGDQLRKAAQQTKDQAKQHRNQSQEMRKQADELQRMASQGDTEGLKLEQHAREADSAEQKARNI
jgi:hypothetical protein